MPRSLLGCTKVKCRPWSTVKSTRRGSEKDAGQFSQVSTSVVTAVPINWRSRKLGLMARKWSILLTFPRESCTRSSPSSLATLDKISSLARSRFMNSLPWSWHEQDIRRAVSHSSRSLLSKMKRPRMVLSSTHRRNSMRKREWRISKWSHNEIKTRTPSQTIRKSYMMESWITVSRPPGLWRHHPSSGRIQS